MSGAAPETRSTLNLVINVIGIVLSVKMLVISIFIYTWDKSAPPMHVAPDMDFQPRFRSQQPATMFADGRGMRPPVEGTIARGELKEDRSFHEGIETNVDRSTIEGDPGSEHWVGRIPAEVNADLLRRGRDRYDIFCAACHGRAGDGVSNVSRFFAPALPRNLHGQWAGDNYRDYKKDRDGYLFDVITNGFSTMKGYANQIPAEDRWAIVAYIRALQACTDTQVER